MRPLARQQPARAAGLPDLPGALDASALASYVAQECGMSAVAGAACGVLIKTAAKLLLVTSVGVAAVIYLLTRHGLVTVHTDALGVAARAAAGLADVDGNGVVDARDLDAAIKALEKKAGGVLPDVAGFSMGLMLGLKL
eukprot:PRCOL_00002180-RA